MSLCFSITVYLICQLKLQKGDLFGGFFLGGGRGGGGSGRPSASLVSRRKILACS